MKFKSKLFSFSTGSDKIVNKTTTPLRKSNPDDFVTELVNSISINHFNNNRDLLLYFFNNVSEINALVTYIAQKSADIPVKHVKLLGNGKQKDISSTSPYLKLLQKPNSLNNGRQFHVNNISSFFVYGYTPINKIAPVGFQEPSELYTFPGNQFYPIPQKHVNMYGLPPSGIDFRLNPIVKYRLFIDNRQIDFDPSEIIMINDSNLSFTNGQYLTGQSRLQSAIRSIKTLSNLYDTLNTLIEGKGAEGFLTKKSKANEADPGWDPDDKKEVEKKLYSYGLTNGKKPIGISEKDLGFVRLSVPLSEFMPIELKEHEFRSLATALGLQAVLFNDTKASTYNNVLQAEKAGYTSCIIPVTNLYYEALSNSFGLNSIGEALVADYSEIECLQDDKKLESEIEKLTDELWDKRYKNNTVTLNEYLRAVGLPELPNGNVYARDSETIPLGVRLGIGGTQALQSVLVDTQLLPDQKENILIIVFGVKPEEAKLMVGQGTLQQTTQTNETQTN